MKQQMNRQGPIAALTLAFLIMISVTTQAAEKSGTSRLHNIFGSHMVIQRDKPILFWGWTEKGQKVSVQFGESKAEVTADKNGRWEATVPAQQANAVGQTLTIKNGQHMFELVDILIGDIWVYSPKVDTAAPPGITIARQFNESIEESLRAGAKVLLLPKLDQLPHSIKGSFQTDFWCFPMFRRGAERRGIEVAPGTLGILCDPRCAALAHFPTEFHSNWQWWHLVKHSRPLILDDTPAAYRPMVQVIDNFERNQKLALLFETRLGAGKLIVCTIDLVRLNDRPEARQFLYSLLQYMDSNAFAPKTELNIALLRKLLTTP